MARVVFDTSVLIALLQSETITMLNLPDLRQVTMGTVNVAEVCTLLTQTERPVRQAGFALLSLLQKIEPFTEDQARLAGEFRSFGKNVSLGDRACLALAVDTGAEVYTADRAWSGFDSSLTIHMIR